MDSNNMDTNNMYQNGQTTGQQTGAEPNGNYQQYPYNNYSNYNNYNNGNYQIPYQQNAPLDLEEPMKVGEWLISLLITMIPCVNLIMIFVWAFGSTEKKSKSNFFKAYLIYVVIQVVIVLMTAFSIAAYRVSIIG